ncbi:MerR family transcriptional regulator [Fictibacillus nanhaiensis]|uniref:MerR family transcriptional regulator n=1 Tax=Fictibacillus nanhaiensis TaxID=742169 RepID=UPI00203E4DEF|nr:MerR family transcriptional regulator [Fictibacillus nanhaiensis]MCM3732990.1 MerR family transcriptional regulator [Fictibacillus nanhaiensis]
MDITDHKAYVTNELSKILNIGTSTLRKWCLALEKNDYEFMRTDQNKRLYVERDVIALRHFQALVQQNNMSLENAALIVSSKFNKDRSSTGTPSVLQNNEENKRSSERSEPVLEQLVEHIKMQQEYIERQEQFNKELLTRLDKQQKYIEERLNERDKALTSSIRELQKSNEEIKQLNAAEPEKKSLLSRLLGK